MNRRRLGIYGGSFDPIHLGHLLLAESAREELGMEQVIFVPAKRSPFKPRSSFAGDDHRWRMLLLAIEENPGFSASRVELDREAPSYTVLTIDYFSRIFPEAELWLILGQDALLDFAHWYQYRRLLQRAKVAVGRRPGVSDQELTLPRELTACADRFCFFTNPVFGVSSREIRERIKQGRSVNYLLWPKVNEYIIEHRLYL
ncbi:MAG TPA: nicotinate (nicotinamide) nucleotide adenylyltransferase [Firmicutes bacterium]|jgi:nicotinate-nucleotide adenylyltransferase|nr:nicotinate (nicotinamide) nucleotide adenylyltransferase [Bacillota bacterium]